MSFADADELDDGGRATGHSDSTLSSLVRWRGSLTPGCSGSRKAGHSSLPPDSNGGLKGRPRQALNRLLDLSKFLLSPNLPSTQLVFGTRRLIACVVLSTSAGLLYRLSVPDADTLSRLSDAAASMLESHLFLSLWSSLGRRSNGARFLRVILALFWTTASFGDFNFQILTGGVLANADHDFIQEGLDAMMSHTNDQPLADTIRVLFRLIIGLSFSIILLPSPTCNNASPRAADKCASMHNCRLPKWNFTLLDHPCPLFTRPKFVNIFMAGCLFFLYEVNGAWAPLTNLFFFAHGQYATILPQPSIYAEPLAGKHMLPTDLTGTLIAKNSTQRPNVIMVVHDSLSSRALQTARGRDAAPFWHHTMGQNPDIYQYTNTLAAAGITQIGTPAILTGLVPYDDDGADAVRRASPAQLFKEAGYHTASFSSSSFSGDTYYLKYIRELLIPRFDVGMLGKKDMGGEEINQKAIDDRITAQHFQRWLTKMSNPPNGSDTKPFFAQILLFNNHFPFVKQDNYSGSFPGHDSKYDRYFSSLRTFDGTLKSIFDALGGLSNGDMRAQAVEGADVLSNTIIVGAGDHAETPGKLKRTASLDSAILGVPMYMHIPRKYIVGTNNGGSFLVKNQGRATSVLDLMPTLKDVLRFPRAYSSEQMQHCLTGRSLLNSSVSESRMVPAWQGPPLKSKKARSPVYAAFATESELFVHTSKGKSHIESRDFDEKDPFFNIIGVTALEDLDAENSLRIMRSLKNEGWLDHNLTVSKLPSLRKAFGVSTTNSGVVCTYNCPWSLLTPKQRDDAEAFGFEQTAWASNDFPRAILKREWSDFSTTEREVLLAKGYERFQWTYQRPTGKEWATKFKGLSARRKAQVKALGFTAALWNADKLPGGVTQRSWDSFSEEDLDVILALGYNASTWLSEFG